MEFRQLLQFYEVCKQGSFSAAGERLYMTQQAVGKSMKQLEDELAVILFIREKSGVSLTPQGKYLESRCEKLFDYIHETEDEIQQIGANCPLRPKVLVPKAAAEEQLENSADTEELLQSPIMEIVIRPEVKEEDLNDPRVHAMIVVDQVQNQMLLSSPLLNLPMCAAIPAEDHSITKKEMTLRDFRRKSLILISDWKETNEHLAHAFREQNVKSEGTVYADSLEEALEKVAEGQGYCVLPERDYDRLQPEGTRKIPIKKRSFTTNMHFVFRKNDPCQKEIKRVYDFLKVRLLRS